MTAWGCDYTTVLDGFSLTSGNANGTLGWDMHGGAMYIRESELTVRNCNFVGNAGWRGGAVGIQDAHPRFENCLFFNNTAEQVGGGIHMLPDGSADIIDCDFRINHATVNYGGALANYEGANLYVFNSRFMDNDANWGGGGIFAASGNTLVANCVFTGNTGDGDRGGAIHTFGPNIFLFVYNCSITNNHAYQCGGVDAFNGALVYLRNTIVYGNTDDDPATNTEAAQIRRENAPGTTLSVISCDIQGWTGILGGTGNIGADPMFVDADGPDNVVGTFDDNLRLSPGSPCIDHGNNSSLPSDSADIDDDNNVIEPLPIDMDGNARRIDDPNTADTGEGTAPIVDLGAYELVPAPVVPGDMDCNGIVNLADIPAMTMALTNPAQYNQTYGCIANGDFTQSGGVNGADLQGFVDLLIP